MNWTLLTRELWVGSFLHLQQCVMWVVLVSITLWFYFRIYTAFSNQTSDLSQADPRGSSCSCPYSRIVFGHLQTPKWCVRIHPLMQKWPGFGRRSLLVIRLIQASLETSVPIVYALSCITKYLWHTVIFLFPLCSWAFVLPLIFPFERAPGFKIYF